MKNVLSRLILIAAVALASSAAYIYFSTKSTVDSMIQSIAPFVTVEYKHFNNFMDGSISIHDVSINTQLSGENTHVDIGSIEVKMDSVLDYFNFEQKINSGEIPPKLQLAINHVHTDVGLLINDSPDKLGIITDYMTELACGEVNLTPSEKLTALGYSGIDSSISIDFEYSRLTSEAEVKFDLILHDMAQYAVKTTIPNVNSTVGLTNPNGKISSLELGIQDLGYNKKLIEYCSNQRGIQPERYVEQHVQALKNYFSDASVSFSDSVYDAYRAYLIEQAHVSISSHPNASFSVESLNFYDTKDWASILDLTLFVDEKPASNFFFDWNKESVLNDLLKARALAEKEDDTEKKQVRIIKRAQKSPKVNAEIPVSQIHDYTNKHVTLNTKSGKTFKGIVKSVKRGQVIMIISIQGGNAEIPIDVSKIIKVSIPIRL